MDQSRVGESAAAVAAALAPYAWQEFTDRMLARRAVGAMDRHAVVAFLTGLPGADIGEADALEPADVGDARVAALVRMLGGQQWRELSLTGLCIQLSSSVAEWHDAQDRDLRRLDGV